MAFEDFMVEKVIVRGDLLSSGSLTAAAVRGRNGVVLPRRGAPRVGKTRAELLASRRQAKGLLKPAIEEIERRTKRAGAVVQ